MKTPERIGMKFGTADYVHKIFLQTKYGGNRISGSFRGVCEIYGFVLNHDVWLMPKMRRFKETCAMFINIIVIFLAQNSRQA